MHVKLQKFGKKNLEKSRGWMNDKDLCRLFNRRFKFLTVAGQRRWYENLLKDKTQLVFAIYANGVYVGNVGLKGIDKENNKAEYYIFIGESSYRGKGVGLESTKKLLNFIRKSLNLNKVYLHVDSKNLPAIKLYKKIGFKREGILLCELFINKKYITMIRMAYYFNQR